MQFLFYSSLNGEAILEMRELAKSVPVVDDVLNYAMNLVANSHPEIKNASDTAKKYIKYGASPRAGQALITAAKVRALINGNFSRIFRKRFYGNAFCELTLCTYGSISWFNCWYFTSSYPSSRTNYCSSAQNYISIFNNCSPWWLFY